MQRLPSNLLGGEALLFLPQKIGPGLIFTFCKQIKSISQTDSPYNRIISIAGQRRLAPQILKLTEELSRAE